MPGKYPFQSLKLSIAAICEYALESRGRWTLVGTFRQLEFKDFPAVLDRMEVYLMFTDAVNDPPREIRVALYDPADDSEVPLFDVGSDLSEGASPRSWECAFQFETLAFPKTGDYDLIVELDGELFELMKLYVRKAR